MPWKIDQAFENQVSETPILLTRISGILLLNFLNILGFKISAFHAVISFVNRWNEAYMLFS